MKHFDRKNHWETIYRTKQLSEVSWYEPTPETSLDFLKQFKVPKTAKIIDVGGGDSFLVDHLLGKGFQNLTVLDISEAAIDRAKKRLGDLAHRVKWIVSDITQFQPAEQYDFWHDRAAFHFLTDEEDVTKYLDIAQKSIKPTGILVIGTFSELGPTKCSGIEIKHYSENSMTERFRGCFEKIKCITVDHKTPFGTIQNFVFCSFKKTESARI